MSWDVMVLNYAGNPPLHDDLRADDALPLGPADTVRAAITRHLPRVDCSNPTWGLYEDRLDAVARKFFTHTKVRRTEKNPAASLSLCQRLTAPDLKRRFASARAANLGRKGAAAFHRQLIKGDLASEYEDDIRVWLEQLA